MLHILLIIDIIQMLINVQHCTWFVSKFHCKATSGIVALPCSPLCLKNDLGLNYYRKCIVDVHAYAIVDFQFCLRGKITNSIRIPSAPYKPMINYRMNLDYTIFVFQFSFQSLSTLSIVFQSRLLACLVSSKWARYLKAFVTPGANPFFETKSVSLT